MMLKLATKYLSIQADVLSGILLAKNMALLLMFDALSPSILNIDVFCPFFTHFALSEAHH